MSYFVIATALLLQVSPGVRPAPGDGSDEVRTDARERTPSPWSAPQGFVENRGQWAAGVEFAAYVPGGFWGIDRGGLTAARVRRQTDDPNSPWDRTRGPEETDVMRLEFEGANANAHCTGTGLAGESHFIRSGVDSPRSYVANRFESVLVCNLYPRIDVRVSNLPAGIKCDLIAHPGARLEGYVVRVLGADLIEVSEGRVVLARHGDPLILDPIEAYSVDEGGTHTKVRCRYVAIDASRFGYRCEEWNGRDTLLVDPGLRWATYYGGSASDTVQDVEWTDDGRVLVAGHTVSPDFPTAGMPWSAAGVLRTDAFIAIFDLSRSPSAQLEAATYFGGSGHEYINSIRFLHDDVLAVAGYTTSSDFPTTVGAFDRSHNGGTYPAFEQDCFVAMFDLSRSGPSQLLFSTLYGSSADEHATTMDAATDGALAIGGVTTSSALPTTNTAMSRTIGGFRDGFVAVFDPAQQGAAQLRYATFIGGIGYDEVRGIKVAASGEVAVVGSTLSHDFPTTAGCAFSSGFPPVGEGFVLILDPARQGSQQLVYSTCLGGSGSDSPLCVGMVSSDMVYVGGETRSPNFPTTSEAIDRALHGASAGFISILRPSQVGQQQLVYSSLIDSTAEDTVFGLKVDRTGIVDLFGITGASDFPTTVGAFQRTIPSPYSEGAAFAMRLNPQVPRGRSLLYSSLVAGSTYEVAFGGDRNRWNWEVAVVGQTESFDFPASPNSWSPHFRGGTSDGFIAILDMLPTGVSALGRGTAGCLGPVALTVNSMPRVGSTSFEVLCVNAPTAAAGVLVLGSVALTTPLDLFGTQLFVDPTRHPILMLGAISSAMGVSSTALRIPAQTWLMGRTVYAQAFWPEAAGSSPCPPLGLSASHALAITIQA